MQQIQTELNKVGKLSFVVSVSNADEKGTSNVLVENSNVVADPASCTIRYHWWSSIHGAVVNDDDVSLSLRDAKGVWTMSNDELLKKQIAKEGTPADQTKGFYQRYVPAMYMVLIALGMTMTTTAAGSRLPIKSRPSGWAKPWRRRSSCAAARWGLFKGVGGLAGQQVNERAVG
jgi:hypothetical protein